MFFFRADVPHLARFKGRPGELSPKARLFLFAGWLLPSRFKCVSTVSSHLSPLHESHLLFFFGIASTEPPFDRHDWIVRRKTGEEVRYVIDYYSAPPEPDGSPVFSLDVRPALDNFWSVRSRLSAATSSGERRV